MTEVELYDDPIIRLIQDPNLNKDRAKTTELLRIINGFPLTERKVSKLCQSCFSILQTLEKLSLSFKSWEFLSLDFNSDNHFSSSDDKIKSFNNNIADKVIVVCKELNRKLNKITADLDHITKASRTLTPIEFISDSGTLLTSLVLRNIKLKNESAENLTISYLKAKLIIIGKELELMLIQTDDRLTILTYKNFIVSLLRQLNDAIELDDTESKYECLAVVNDMEKMFDAFKLEKAREVAVYKQKENEENERQRQLEREQEQKRAQARERQIEEERAKHRQLEEERAKHRELDRERTKFEEEKIKLQKLQRDDEFVDLVEEFKPPNPIPIPTSSRQNHHSMHSSRRESPNISTPRSDMDDVDDYDYSDSEVGYNSLYSSTLTQPPLIHSITKTNDSHSSSLQRRDSISSLSTSTLLHKTTISDELPYLMTAFSSAKNFEEDVSHFKEEEEKRTPQLKSQNKIQSKLSQSVIVEGPRANKIANEKHFYNHKSHLPDTSLYSESVLLNRSGGNSSPGTSPASSYLFSNNSLLSKLGIKPQVITTEFPAREMALLGRTNQQLKQLPQPALPPATEKLFIKNEKSSPEDDSNKENQTRLLTPLTKANLECHTFSKLAVDQQFNDFVE